MKPFNQNAIIRGAIRRTFARAPIKQELLRENRKQFPKYNKDGSRSKKDAVCYLCAVCKEYRGSTEITVDHVIPVISIEEGFIDWNTFVDRLYCGKENLQTICDFCHQVKSNRERFERTYKKEKQILTRIRQKIIYSYDYLTTEDIKFLKRFTPKRLAKYPSEFVSEISYLKDKIKKKL